MEELASTLPKSELTKSDPDVDVSPDPSIIQLDRKAEQRLFIKSCVKNGKSGAEILRLLKTDFGEDCLSKATVYNWIKRFQEGRESVKDNSRSGRPMTSRNNEMIDKVLKKIKDDRNLPIRKIAKELKISFGSCQAILAKDF